MPVKTLYFKNVTVNGALSLQDGGTAPTGAITSTGWTVGKLAIGNFSLMAVGTKRATTAFSTTDALGTPSFSAASCWRSESSFNGTFANTDWTFRFHVRAVSAAASQQGRVNVRIWKSANADGSSATQLTSAPLVGGNIVSITTTASGESLVTWAAPGALTFDNEYLWVQCEWEIRGVSSNNSGDVVYYVESTARINTPNFVGTPVYAQRHFRFRTDANIVSGTPTWAQPEDTSIPSGSYADINYRLRISVENTGVGSPSNTWTLRYSKNGGAYTAITTSSAVVRAVDAGASPDNTQISTQLLSSSTGTFNGFGIYSETGTTGATTSPDFGLFDEFEFGIKIVAADVANGDTIDFQIWPNTTAAITQVVTPRITVAVASGISGTGTLAAGAAVLAGSGVSASTGTGALAAGAATAAGVGTSASVGTGALAAQAAALAGAGASASAGTGALVAGAASLAGSGAAVSPAITGTGVLTAGAAAIAGTGTSASVGAGSLAAEIATLAGTGASVSTGSGMLVAGAAEVAGTGAAVAAGDAVAPGAVLSLTLALLAGAATGEGVIPPAVVISRPMRLRYDAIAPGARLRLQVRLLPGGVIVDAAPRGVVLPLVRTAVVAGHATGEGQTEYDNAIVLLLAA